MSVRFFDFYGKPARVTVDNRDGPEVCEIFDPEQGAFVRRDELTLDVIDSHGSHLIAREQFEMLLAKVKGKPKQARRWSMLFPVSAYGTK